MDVGGHWRCPGGHLGFGDFGQRGAWSNVLGSEAIYVRVPAVAQDQPALAVERADALWQVDDHGLKAPIQTGMMSSAYIAETCVNFFGEAFFRNATMEGKFVKPIYAGELITTHGIVRESTPEGDGGRLKVELWADNEDGEVKTVVWATAHVE